MTNLQNLQQKLSVQKDDYQSCLAAVEHSLTLSGVIGNIRLHHLRFDGNGKPMIKALAEILYSYIIDYCIASRNRCEPLSAPQYARLTKEARRLFRHPVLSDGENDQTGEAGEALLFLLVEAVLSAPQIVAKMELKTNNKDEIKGSDGIHARWSSDGFVDFYFGESKLYQNANAAISAALASIETFHKNEMYKHEFNLVTKHFKYADEAVKNEIAALIRTGEPGAGVRLNHACLIGYDWNRYASVAPHVLKDQIGNLLLEDSEKIAAQINQIFVNFTQKHLVFEIFLLPFPSVSEFRNAFNAALD